MRETVAIALGTFDGIHKGHLAVLKSATDCKVDKKVAITFAAPPGKEGAKLIMPESIKEESFIKLGFDEVFLLDFAEVKDMSPLEFLQMLSEKYNIKSISCGFNYRFGKGATGNTELLQKWAVEKGAECRIVEPVMFEGEPISSTRIRAAIEQGNMPRAAEMLGFDFFIEAPVVSGDARGRKMGFPTANQIPEENAALPKFGVYKTTCEIDGKTYPAITNIGIRPTYKTETPIAETYIIDFSGDLYGKTVKVNFKKFIREERKFSCLDEVKAQIAKDIKF